jgi:putative oligomerization/nucleic acid binding protein
MKRLGVLGIGALLCLLVSAPARAQTPTPHPTFSSAEECVQSVNAFPEPPTCIRTGNGWVVEVPVRSIPVGGPGVGVVGLFFLLALVFSVAPAALAGMLASSRGQSVGLAVVLALLLGWIGLIIVAVAFKPQVAEEVRNLSSRVLAPPAPNPGPSRDTRARIEELNDLRERGLITPEEYASRRESILGQI